MPLSITKPTVGGSFSTWGTTLNAALDAIVAGVNQADGFNVRNYGAVLNNSTNDATAIQSAITAATAAGGGVVDVPGKAAVGSTITLPSNVVLRGSGRGASQLRRTFSGAPLIDHSGSGTSGDGSTHVHYGGLQGLTLHGNDATGPILRTYYADQFYATDVHFVSSDDSALDAVELWDSRFTLCDFTNASGTTGSAPSVNLRSSSAGSGFGASIDNINNVYFVSCRIEGFQDGALWVRKGPAGTAGDPYGIFVVNLKCESHTVRGDYIVLDDASTHVHFTNLETYVGAFDSGYTTPIHVVSAQGYGINSIRNFRVTSGTAGVVHSGLFAYSGSGATIIDNASYRGQAPTAACVYLQDWGGGPGDIRIRDASCDSGLTLFGGAYTPSVAAGAGAGTGPSGVTVTGSNLSHVVSMTTGTSTSAAAVATVTLTDTLGGTPGWALTPRSASAAAANLYVSAATASAVTVSAQTAPAASTALSFDLVGTL